MNTQPEPCTTWDTVHATRLWHYAILQYAVDARNALRIKHPQDGEIEALDDLTSDCKLLAHLCQPLDYDVVMVATALMELIASGKSIR